MHDGTDGQSTDDDGTDGGTNGRTEDEDEDDDETDDGTNRRAEDDDGDGNDTTGQTDDMYIYIYLFLFIHIYIYMVKRVSNMTTGRPFWTRTAKSSFVCDLF